jgi:hypothetical protein
MVTSIVRITALRILSGINIPLINRVRQNQDSPMRGKSGV